MKYLEKTRLGLLYGVSRYFPPEGYGGEYGGGWEGGGTSLGKDASSDGSGGIYGTLDTDINSAFDGGVSSLDSAPDGGFYGPGGYLSRDAVLGTPSDTSTGSVLGLAEKFSGWISEEAKDVKEAAVGLLNTMAGWFEENNKVDKSPSLRGLVKGSLGSAFGWIGDVSTAAREMVRCLAVMETMFMCLSAGG